MFRYRHPEIAQEEDELPWGRVILAYLGMIAIGIALVAWAWSAMLGRERQLRPSRQFPEKDLGPRHEVGMVEQALFDHEPIGQGLFDAQRRELERFGVVDRDHGIVSIPIDDAIQLSVEEAQR